MEVRERLQAAQREPAVVRVNRGAFEAGGELGYVVAMASDLILLLCISNQIRFEGFAVIRASDITELEAPHAHDQFVEEALRRRGESVSDSPPVDLTSIESAIQTAGKLYPVLAIHREEVDAEVCHVGAIVGVSAESVSILEIDPDAEWDEEPTVYAMPEITRIEFGGGYEEALALVGGNPPLAPHLWPAS